MPLAEDLHGLRDARVLVAGWGISGRAVIDPLRILGARIVVTDGRADSLAEAVGLGLDSAPEAELLAAGGLDDIALVITSPGFRPEAPLLIEAARRGIPVWGDIEFSWRVDHAELYGPTRRWLVVTGTNGKTTTTTMLHTILRAAGLGSAACGNIGLPVIDALRRPDVRVLAVELSSFQLYWAPSVRPNAGAVLNIAEDHLDWHGGLSGYVAAKARALAGNVAVVGLDDPVAAALPHTAGFRIGEPGPKELGVRDGRLVDRAFAEDADLGPADTISPPGPAGILDALAAAALARAILVPPRAIIAGLAAHHVGPHRASAVRELGGVTFVDDSKATNPHAARSSLLAHPHVVWVAGGQLKGATVDDLVAEVASRLRGAVLIGVDATKIAAALARHAPEVPVLLVPTRDDAGVTAVTDVTPATDVTDPDAVMANAVRAAARLARPGDTVLLAPAAASLDMFRSYGHRGDSFAVAAAELTEADLGTHW
ncbi:UDP-N-acetylmuramoyl-L-alanine--D-glutamate ligase [Aldersonia sp. NBC_00410]|uniref:UDP-N-acetylmuramoyl-L-alanine--D-glutamate ligase n=1 Tax=Aldersonia sp. NBC_00410 TaxID=2975954 RepID=UPI002259831B|nr:UDP-N-acetylmuramoyl-L-alanine--D-glutamate ligase [Aldersonia sp. NBC_00410]MCX5045983.1 UDP-N-acetylmuramoyl-L-alanine--D-glutamate ligase [Aldersonia sp. NBC_00410]